jgi:uncharacterized protein YndB with AHSA1/START domain
VLVALRVDVPAQRAFDVFVNDIGVWWQPNGLFRTSPGAPGTLAFEGGDGGVLVETSPDGESYHIGRVLEWKPPQRLVFSWQQPDFPDDLVTEVEVRFDAVEEGVTRVSVEHRGFTGVPAGSAARHGFPDAALQMRLAEWWRALLGNLAARCRQP